MSRHLNRLLLIIESYLLVWLTYLIIGLHWAWILPDGALDWAIGMHKNWEERAKGVISEGKGGRG